MQSKQHPKLYSGVLKTEGQPRTTQLGGVKEGVNWPVPPVWRNNSWMEKIKGSNQVTEVYLYWFTWIYSSRETGVRVCICMCVLMPFIVIVFPTVLIDPCVACLAETF